MLAEAEAPARLRPATSPCEAVLFAEERALAASVGRGNPNAATIFARRLLPVARRVTRGLVGPGSDAEDLCQVALIELLRAAPGYAGHGSLEAWARRITVRISLRALKRRRRIATVELEEEHLPGEYATYESLREHLPRTVEHYLQHLPEAQRTALLLRHALEHTLPEIAELTGAPVPTVKSRVLKAMATVRRLIRRDLNLGNSSPNSPSNSPAKGLR